MPSPRLAPQRRQRQQKCQPQHLRSGEGDAANIAIRAPKSRSTPKVELDTRNVEFDKRLQQRICQPPCDAMRHHQETLQALSREHASTAAPRKVGPHKVVDKSFLEGASIHIYSGQKLNSADLQKQALRTDMLEQHRQTLWTYSSEHNSGCFPMLDKDIPSDRMLRQSVVHDDGRDPWRYPRPREREHFAKPSRSVSEARKDELQSPWVENELFPELQQRRIIPGAFDAKSLGTGGAHVIPTRETGLQECPAPVPAVSEPTVAQMKFMARCNVGIESMMDRYTQGIREGEPMAHSLRFCKRKPPSTIIRKYGLGQQGLTDVEVPPVSIALAENPHEKAFNSDCATSFMKSVSRPLVPCGGADSSCPPFAPSSVVAARQPLSARSPAQTRAQVWKACVISRNGRDNSSSSTAGACNDFKEAQFGGTDRGGTGSCGGAGKGGELHSAVVGTAADSDCVMGGRRGKTSTTTRVVPLTAR
mmetsp:Transcript_47947/g.126490  ORF Transcript_47947/g.126490 Transcript_47947/m.126490 type:complete len:476 (-) Transcript_47947:6-1433(-)